MKALNDWIKEGRMAGYRAIADACGVRWQTPQKWLRRGKIPIEHVGAVSRVTGIPPADLNPHVAGLIRDSAA